MRQIIIILFILISFNLQGQKKVAITLSEGFIQFDKFNNYQYPNSESWYYSRAIQSELELSYNILSKRRYKLNIGLGIANTYFFDTALLFPIEKQSNSLFSKIHFISNIGKSPFYIKGSLGLYYLPPLFRKYYSQKKVFESFEFGIGYRLPKGLTISISAKSSITSPYINDRLFRFLGTHINPNLEFTGISLGVSKPIF